MRMGSNKRIRRYLLDSLYLLLVGVGALLFLTETLSSARIPSAEPIETRKGKEKEEDRESLPSPFSSEAPSSLPVSLSPSPPPIPPSIGRPRAVDPKVLRQLIRENRLSDREASYFRAVELP